MDYPSFLTEKRINRLRDVVSKRQFDLTIVLENIHDPHNIAAVIRTCDAVGIREIYVLLNDKRIDPEKYDFMHNDVSSGSMKWVKINMFSEVDSLVKELRQNYDVILGTHLSEESVSLYDIEFNKKSIALVFGNEHDGITGKLLEEIDGNYTIPQFGMVQSLNISVACAVSVYEALRQKLKADSYSGINWNEHHDTLFAEYAKISKPKLAK